jgi:hypothetical protein
MSQFGRVAQSGVDAPPSGIVSSNCCACPYLALLLTPETETHTETYTETYDGYGRRDRIQVPVGEFQSV